MSPQTIRVAPISLFGVSKRKRGKGRGKKKARDLYTDIVIYTTGIVDPMEGCSIVQRYRL